MLVLLITRNLKVQFWSKVQCRNIHTKFYKNPFIRSRYTECVQTDDTCGERSLGLVGFGKVSDAHALRIMRTRRPTSQIWASVTLVL
jgi:hypothetical protein